VQVDHCERKRTWHLMSTLLLAQLGDAVDDSDVDVSSRTCWHAVFFHIPSQTCVVCMCAPCISAVQLYVGLLP
jgi:hypothetical protein